MRCVWSIPIALLVLVGPAAFAGKPSPPPPAGPWDIAYGSQLVSKGDLTVMQVDTGLQQVLYVTPSPQTANYPRFPDWSHDGKYVSFNLYNIEGRVLQVATGKSCWLYPPHGTTPEPMKFHPSFGEGVGDGHYVVAYTNWNNTNDDLYFTELWFEEGNCRIGWNENVSHASIGLHGAAWSPVGTADATQLATIAKPGAYSALLRIYDVARDIDGHLRLTGTYVDYPLDPSLYYPAGLGCTSGCSLQWSSDPHILGLVAQWSPDGGTTHYADVYSIDISTNPPVLTNLTNTEADETYFDFRANGDGIVAGNEDGIWLFPASGAPVLVAPLERKKWPKDPAWNPTRW